MMFKLTQQVATLFQVKAIKIAADLSAKEFPLAFNAALNQVCGKYARR